MQNILEYFTHKKFIFKGFFITIFFYWLKYIPYFGLGVKRHFTWTSEVRKTFTAQTPRRHTITLCQARDMKVQQLKVK